VDGRVVALRSIILLSGTLGPWIVTFKGEMIEIINFILLQPLEKKSTFLTKKLPN
jgi:hypothetical protein